MTQERRDFLRSRKPFTPKTGEWYRNENGAEYYCVCGRTGVAPAMATMKSKSGWQFIAHGIGIYIDGSIDWDYSTSGRFI